MFFNFKKTKRKIPKHVVIIPDGNRRWARKKGLVSTKGHEKAGSKDNIKGLMTEARNLGVKYFSVWGFSTENWKRDKKEVDKILNVIYNALKFSKKEMIKNGVCFRHIGRKDRLPKKLMKLINEIESSTKNNKDFYVQFLLDYGGRDEIIRAINKVIKNKKKRITEKTFEEFLDTSGLLDPDLVIRTSGEKRMSGLLPYQIVYSEYYFTDKKFPDFTRRDLRKAILSFGKRNRRFGGNSK